MSATLRLGFLWSARLHLPGSSTARPAQETRASTTSLRPAGPNQVRFLSGRELARATAAGDDVVFVATIQETAVFVSRQRSTNRSSTGRVLCARHTRSRDKIALHVQQYARQRLARVRRRAPTVAVGAFAGRGKIRKSKGVLIQVILKQDMLKFMLQMFSKSQNSSLRGQ